MHLTGINGCISPEYPDGYLGLNFKKISILKNSLVKFSFNASTINSNGKGVVQVLYKWANNYQVKNIAIKGSTNKHYEIYIPFFNPQDIIFRFIASVKNDSYSVRNLEISYLPLS